MANNSALCPISRGRYADTSPERSPGSTRPMGKGSLPSLYFARRHESSFRLPLLELPMPCLARVCDTIGPTEKLALLASCCTLRDVCLSTPEHVTINAFLDSRHSVEVAYRCLKRAARTCRSAQEVRLRLLMPDAVTGGSSAAALCMMSIQDPEQPQGLSGVSVITLTTNNESPLYQHSLLPPYLSLACKHISAINLDYVVLQELPDEHSHVPVAPNVQRINFVNCQVAASTAAVKNQLRGLPNLSSITIADCDWPDWAWCLSDVGQQLTSLHARGMSVPDGFACQLDTLFPHIQELEIDALAVDDSIMDVLLGIPSLRAVHVQCFRLRRGHHHLLCNWQEVAMQYMDVTSMAFMPSPSCRSTTLTLKPEPGSEVATAILLPHSGLGEYADVQLTRAAVQQTGRWGGLHCRSVWCESIVFKRDPAYGIDPDSSSIPAALVEVGLGLVKSLTVSLLQLRKVQPVTRSLVSALSKELPSTCLFYFQDCTWGSNVLPTLLSTLGSENVSIQWTQPQCRVSERQALEMCKAATKPCTVSLDGPGIDKACAQRVNAALESTGSPRARVMDDQSRDEE